LIFLRCKGKGFITTNQVKAKLCCARSETK